MRAAVGDRIVIRGYHVGKHGRDAVIVAVEGQDGQAPYLVRWEEDGHESLFFPGPDALVEHHAVGQDAKVTTDAWIG
jgi:Domain of unknown function (DUF1918)